MVTIKHLPADSQTVCTLCLAAGMKAEAVDNRAAMEITIDKPDDIHSMGYHARLPMCPTHFDHFTKIVQAVYKSPAGTYIELWGPG